MNNLAPDVPLQRTSSTSYGVHSPSSSTSMAIESGRGIGPFRIGMDIGTTLTIASQYEENSNVIVDRSNPFIHDTILDLPNLKFRLCFDGYSQRLHVIIVNLQSSVVRNPLQQENLVTSSNVLRSVLNFSFGGIPLIRSTRCPPDLRYIYRICGPTIPGHYQQEPSIQTESLHDSTTASPLDTPNPSTVSYYLKYPGLAFRFPVPYEDFESLQSSDEDLLPFILPVSSTRGFTTPIVDRLFVFPSDSKLTDSNNPPWISPSPIMPSMVSTAFTSYEDIHSTPSSQTATSIDRIDHIDTATIVPLSLIPKQRCWNVRVTLRERITFPWGGSIYFGAALQDVYAEIGVPDRVTLKDIDVVGIMSSHVDLKTHLENNDDEITSQLLGLTNEISRPDESLPADYFCNYFSKGFDLLISGTTHRVKKIILHTNLPGHVQFGDYTRCFFSITLKGQSPAAIDVDSSWNDIERYLGISSPPLLVDLPSLRQSALPGGSQAVRKFYGYPGMAIEVFDKKWIASITLF